MNDRLKYLGNPTFLIHTEAPTDLLFVLLSQQNSLNVRVWAETPENALLFQEVIEFNRKRSIVQQEDAKGKGGRRSARSSSTRWREEPTVSSACLELLTETCLGNSGPYRHNCCTLTLKDAQPLRYLVIVSTFHALGRESATYYNLELMSTREAEINLQQLSGGGNPAQWISCGTMPGLAAV